LQIPKQLGGGLDRRILRNRWPSDGDLGQARFATGHGYHHIARDCRTCAGDLLVCGGLARKGSFTEEGSINGEVRNDDSLREPNREPNKEEK
jgi:hypothetical protein